MKQIFTDVQDRLSLISGLKYIDKDWGQLQLEQPAAKFPCALIDIDSVTYSNRSDKTQMADGNLVITIAGMRLSNSSLKAPNKDEAYKTIEMVRDVNSLLHLWHTEFFSKLIRTALRRVECAPGYDCYQLTYHITWWDMLVEPEGGEGVGYWRIAQSFKVS